MNRRWSIAAFSALVACANAAEAQKLGHLEVTVLPQYSWMFAERELDNAIGVGGALALFLSNRVKLTAGAAYHPTNFQDTGADVALVPLRFGAAYEHPLSAKTRAVAGAHFSYISSPKEELNDVGFGLSAALKFGLTQKLSLITQLMTDLEPAWFNPRTYHVNPLPNPSVTFHHTPDGYIALGAGLSLRLGSDGAAPTIIVMTEPPRTPPPLVKSATSDTAANAPAQPQPAPPPTTPAPQPQPERTVELEPIYFDFDRALLRDDAAEALNRIVAILQANPGSIILIEGHTDERGTDTYNERLGKRRAATAYAYLLKLGLETARLHTMSLGEKQPAVADHTEQAYAHNRRVEFRLQSGGPLRPVNK